MLNIALVLCESDNKSLEKISKKLNEDIPSTYILGENSIPHVSLTHIEAEPGEAERMWEKLMATGVEIEYDITLKNFCVNAPYKERIYTEFRLENVGILMKLQDFIMRTFPENKVTSNVGADFSPHITTSCHLDLKAQSNVRPFKPPFRKTKACLAIGTKDSYGRMEKVLYMQDIFND